LPVSKHRTADLPAGGGPIIGRPQATSPCPACSAASSGCFNTGGPRIGRPQATTPIKTWVVAPEALHLQAVCPDGIEANLTRRRIGKAQSPFPYGGSASAVGD
jgi:hypothetical protein